MLNSILQIFAGLFLLAGLFFTCVGVIGVLKLPDFFNRMHAASKCTTLGLSGLVIGAALYGCTLDGANVAEVVGRAVLLIAFQFLAGPVGAHVLSKAAYSIGTPRVAGTQEDSRHRDA